MADNNLAQSSVSAEEIHEMANAAREMANNFNDANKELSITISLLDKMNKLTGRTPGSGRTSGGGRTHRTSGGGRTRRTTTSGNSTRHTSSASSALRSESEQILSQLTGGKFSKVANKLKFGPIIAVLTAVISVARKLVQVGEQLRKTYGNAQKDLSALGQTSSNLNTYMQTDAKALADLQSKTHALGAVFGAVGNIIKSTVEKVANSLLNLVPQMEELEKSLAGVNRRQSIASAQMKLIGQGMKYGAAGTTASNIEAAAVAYLTSAYGYSATEARNSSDYTAAVEAMTSLVTSGGQSGMFNTANVQGYGYANQIWQPGVHYTDAYMTAMRSQMLSDALSIYQEQGAEGLADWNNSMAKMQTLVGNIASSLYSFDEVEQLNATNLDDLDTSVQDLGTGIEQVDNKQEKRELSFWGRLLDRFDKCIDALAALAHGEMPFMEFVRTWLGLAWEQLVDVLDTILDGHFSEWLNDIKTLASTFVQLLKGEISIVEFIKITASALLDIFKVQIQTVIDLLTKPFHVILDNIVAVVNSIINAINRNQPSTSGNTSASSSASAVRSGATTVEQVQAARRQAEQVAARQTQQGNARNTSSAAIQLDRSAAQAAFENLHAEVKKAGQLAEYSSQLNSIQADILAASDQATLNRMAASLNSAVSAIQTRNVAYTLQGLGKIQSGTKVAAGILAAGFAALLGAGAGLELAGAYGGSAATSAASGMGAEIIQFPGAAGAANVGSNVIQFPGLPTASGFATGGIGTSKVTNATLFENGPEAVIPLYSDLGKTFMADSISQALDLSYAGGTTVNVHIDGPIFTENERQLNQWAEKLGDRFIQIQARRGGK